MTNQLPSEPQMTDVFGRFPNPLPRVGDTSEAKISNRKKALLGTAAVLLGGGAAFAAINFDEISAGIDGDEIPADSVTAGTGENGAPGKPDLTSISVRHHTASAVQSGTITPNENIAIAGQVEEQMTFGQAYAAAREETGPGGIFSWHGQVYNTYTVEEWQGLSLGQRQEFLSDVGYRPSQSAGLIEEVPSVLSGAGGFSQIASTNSGQGTPIHGSDAATQDAEPTYIELVINGRPALGIDDDHDGIANAIVFMDEGSNDLLAFVDAEGDNRIDTAIQFDSVSQQIVGQRAIEQPFLAEISQLEAMRGWVDEPLDYDIAMVADGEGTFDDDDNDYTDDEGYVNDAELPEMD